MRVIISTMPSNNARQKNRKYVMSNKITANGHCRATHFGVRYFIALNRLWMFRTHTPVNSDTFSCNGGSLNPTDFIVNAGESCSDALGRCFAENAKRQKESDKAI